MNSQTPKPPLQRAPEFPRRGHKYGTRYQCARSRGLDLALPLASSSPLSHSGRDPSRETRSDRLELKRRKLPRIRIRFPQAHTPRAAATVLQQLSPGIESPEVAVSLPPQAMSAGAFGINTAKRLCRKGRATAARPLQRRAVRKPAGCLFEFRSLGRWPGDSRRQVSASPPEP